LDRILQRGIRKIVSSRVVALCVLAAVVLVAGVYLFHAVHETTSVSAAVPTRHDSTSTPDVVTPSTGRAGDHAPVHAEAPPEVASSDPSADDVDVGTGSANPKLDAVMDQANKAYDRQDYEDAKTIAGKILAKLPKNTRMLRIMVSASCMDGDNATAQKYYEQLPKPDRLQMRARCDRNGVTFTEPPQ
jgi:hypothetical protein